MSETKSDAPALPRRFYKCATVADGEGGYGVALDARTLRTPGGAVFVGPTRALAQACADEWAAQGEHIIPATMPVSQMAFAALDWTAKNRDQICDYVAKFGETDLCCHRAEAPVELATRQAELWDPFVAWGAEVLGVSLPVVTGVLAADVAPEAIEALRQRAGALDDFRLTGLSQATGLAGSALIGFAVTLGAYDAARAFEATALDNLWSLERWGEDDDARARLVRQHAEFDAIVRYLDALK
ncbi:MAG: ATP12 family protein [Hyphomonadaceae bacterium]